MAERFKEVVNIQPVDTRTGGAQAALSLADKLEGFKSQFTQIAAQQAVKRGEKSAAGTSLVDKDGVTQAPAFQKEGFFGSIESAAHNKALKGAYLASLSNDINESVTRIEGDNPADSMRFNDEIGGFSKGVLSGVDPSVRNEVVNFLDSKVIAARGRVFKANRAKDRTEAEATMNLAASNAADNAKNSARDGDLLSSAESLNEARTINQGMVDAGFLSEDEQAIKNRELEFEATKELMLGGVRSKVEAGDFDGVVKDIQKLKEKRPKGFTTEEHDEVVDAAISELNESIALANKLEDEQEEDMKATQNGNYVDLFSGILTGTKNSSDVIKSAKTKGISGEQMSKLITTLNSRGKGVNDWDLIIQIEQDIEDGIDVTDSIIASSGVNLTGAKASELLGTASERNNPESILNTAQAKSERGFIKIIMGPSGFLDKLDPAAKENFAFALREYDSRVIAGENPSFVSDSILAKEKIFEKIGRLSIGSPNNLVAARSELDAQFDAGLIDDSTYDAEFAKQEAYGQVVDAFESMNKARKDTLNAP